MTSCNSSETRIETLAEDNLQTVLPETEARLRRLMWFFFVPLAVLAWIGAYYLTEDRRLAHQRAQADALEFLQAAVRHIGLSNALRPELEDIGGGYWIAAPKVEPEAVIYRDWNGNDLHPMPENAHAAKLDLPDLDGKLAEKWRMAEEAEFRDEPSVGIAGYRRFLKMNPSSRHVHEARYRLALLHLRGGYLDRAIEAIEALLEECEPYHPLHQRAQWLRVVRFPRVEGSEFKAACASWVSAPTEESRKMLEKIGDEGLRGTRFHAIEFWKDYWDAERKRLEREDRFRELSPRIPNRLGSAPEWKLLAYLVDNRPDDLFVMRRPAPSKKGHVLVAWTQAQLGRLISPFWSPERLEEVRRPQTVNMIQLQLEGRGIWGHSWPTRSQFKLLSGDSFANLKMAPIATNVVEGFHVVAHAAPGVIVWESNKRVAWFGLLMLFAAVISVTAWRFTRRSVLHLDALNQEKSNFVSSVSHELRTPVASMQLMAESLHEGKISAGAKQKEYFAMILHECRRLGSLVHNVLDFARIEQRRKEYEFSSCNLSDLIEHAANLMRPTAEEREIRISVQSMPLEAEVDAEAIQQALINLLDNAIKFSPPGSEVSVGLSDLEGGGVGIAVSDHGSGVPEDQQVKIFERFYRREDELRRETKGVGIGLSIVKHIVEAHGGRVKVATNEHQGAVFVIEIPKRNRKKDDVTNSVG